MAAEPDEQDTHALTKILALIQAYVSSQQALMDKTLGSPDLTRMLRKTG